MTPKFNHIENSTMRSSFGVPSIVWMNVLAISVYAASCYVCSHIRIAMPAHTNAKARLRTCNMLTSDGAQATAWLGIFAIKVTMQASRDSLRVICGRPSRAMVVLPRRQFSCLVVVKLFDTDHCGVGARDPTAKNPHPSLMCLEVKSEVPIKAETTTTQILSGFTWAATEPGPVPPGEVVKKVPHV